MKKKTEDLDLLIKDYNHQIEKIMVDTDNAKQKLDKIRKLLEIGEASSVTIKNPEVINKNSNFICRMVDSIKNKMKN